MGRQDSDPAGAIVGPSIALLQERFKKLERIKEKRQEERQVNMCSSISEARRIIVPTNYNNNNNSFSDDHQMFVPSRPAAPFHQDPPLSLGLNLNVNKHADYRALRGSGTARPSFTALWSAHDKRGVKRPQKPDVSDVDTTLHL